MLLQYVTCFFLFPSSLLDLDQLARPSYQAELRSAPQHGYPLGMGSDVETETEGGPSPDHALRLWMQEIKSEHSSCLSSRANSVLSLTDTEQERKSDGENGKTTTTRGYTSLTYICHCLCVLTI